MKGIQKVELFIGLIEIQGDIMKRDGYKKTEEHINSRTIGSSLPSVTPVDEGRVYFPGRLILNVGSMK